MPRLLGPSLTPSVRVRPWAENGPAQIPGWTLTDVEDFSASAPLGTWASDGSLDPSNPYEPMWDVYADGNPISTGGEYWPSLVVSADGTLVYDLHWDTDIFRSAGIGWKTPATYGRWAYRMRGSATGSGVGVVALLWPMDDESWPGSGEMDWPEGDPTADVAGFHHFADPNGTQDPISSNGRLWTDWHVYEIIWTSGSVEYRIDGVPVYETSSMIPSTDMSWRLQSGFNDSENPPAAGTTATVEVDWVARYVQQ